MRRTQIYLPEELHRKLKHMAVRDETSISQIIRTATEESLKEKIPKQSDMLDFLLDIGRTYKRKDKAPKDLSKKIDYYLYDEPYK